MVHALEPTKALVAPFDTVAPFVERRRWVLPLLLFALTGALAASAYAFRWDPAPSTLRALEQSGEMTGTTEQEISKQIVTAGRVKLVTGVLGSVFVLPLMLLALAVVLKVTAWLLGEKARFSAALSASAIASLPLSLRQLIFALCAIRQPVLSDGAEKSLVPSNLAAFAKNAAPPLEQVLGAVDFFSLWSVGLLALGFAAATGMRKSRALPVVLILYVVYVGVFMIGLPALAMQQHGGHP